jgi:hypothetical protein
VLRLGTPPHSYKRNRDISAAWALLPRCVARIRGISGAHCCNEKPQRRHASNSFLALGRRRENLKCTPQPVASSRFRMDFKSELWSRPAVPRKLHIKYSRQFGERKLLHPHSSFISCEFLQNALFSRVSPSLFPPTDLAPRLSPSTFAPAPTHTHTHKAKTWIIQTRPLLTPVPL